MANGKYATVADLKAKWGQVIIDQLVPKLPDSSVDTLKLTLMWEEVDSEIDAYLASGGYKVNNTSSVPILLKSIAVTLAYGSLFTGKVDEATAGKVAETRGKLKAIASGKMKLELKAANSGLTRKNITANAKGKPKSIIKGM